MTRKTLEREIAECVLKYFQATGSANGSAPKPVTKAAPKAKKVKQVTESKSPEGQIHDYVMVHPGCRGQEISMALGLDPKHAGYLYKKLCASKHLKAKGKTRARVYTATAKAWA